MATKHAAMLKTYADLMTEAVTRKRWIDYSASGGTGMDGPLVVEFGFLQLRMICELVALGCLVAHDEVAAPKAQRLKKSYSAAEIMKGLEQLEPDFFPHAHTAPVPQADGVKRFGFREPDYMTKEEFLRLYERQCGDALHRGSLKNLLKSRLPLRKGYPEVIEPAGRLFNLLEIHRIVQPDGQLICWLNDPHYRRVRTVYAARIEPAQK